MKQKLYYSELDDGFAYTLDNILDDMKEQDLTELKVYEGVRELKTDYFFCKAEGEIFLREAYDNPCGKVCPDYDPRNGKSGCCTHRGFCYVPGKEFLIVDGKLTEKL